MKLLLVAAIAGVLFSGPVPHAAQEIEEFTPFDERALRLVNSVAFEGVDSEAGDLTMYLALLHQEVLAHRGTPSADAPVTALYRSSRTPDGWSEPTLMSFSGTYQDYEATMNRLGTMVFNSKRPYPDGRIPELNDLYLVERQVHGGWGEPRSIEAINTFDNEESYPTMMADGSLVFLRGRPGPDGEPAYDLYESRFVDGEYRTPTRHPVSTDRYGEGDPWIAPDGSYLFFTRWDDRLGWAESVDLYVAFQEDGRWSEPVALDELNTPGADFGVAVSPFSTWLFYKNGSRFYRRPLAPVLEAARSRASTRH